MDIYNELNGANNDVHRLENVMTLASTLPGLFDRPELWFETTVAPSLFLFPHLTNGPLILPICTTFSQVPTPSTRGQAFPPARRLQLNGETSLYHLEPCAAWCRVAHMSGTAGYYRDLYEDDPFATKLRTFDPVKSDLPAALQGPPSRPE